MAKASSENNGLKKVLARLTALDKKVDKGFKHMAVLNKKVDKGFKEVDQRFREAAEDRQDIRNEVQVLRHGMQLGFKAVEEAQRKTDAAVAGLYRELPEIGDMAYKHSDAQHADFLKFQK